MAKMYTNSQGISYYKRKGRYFKNSGWLERLITKEEYDQAIKEWHSEPKE